MSLFRVSPLPRLLRTQLSHAPIRTSRTLCTSTRTETVGSKSFLNSYRLAVAVSLPVLAIGVPLASSQSNALKCESDRSYAVPATGDGPELPRELPAPSSILDLQTLSFSTASGICVGIFLVKGAKFIAFALGGIFVGLQYMSSRSLVTIHWSSIESTWDSLLGRHTPAGYTKSNRVMGIGARAVDFLTADVQSRATFLAGLALGMRLG